MPDVKAMGCKVEKQYPGWSPWDEGTVPSTPGELYSIAQVQRIRRTFYSQKPTARLADEVAGLRDDIAALKLRIEEIADA